ncbi:hypothetical protein DBR43_27180 [Pedobacter sp. KBW06]|uniref:RagB/SusD family nutrient uptake outer membrane protein n=1 Tax=Pedobacter sp. KBW06 TaxID=2153359 RepID=UPI000F5B68A7|nr:RagB/SusD family nutrient uptake outer membrane protein [Pedobacter sp. KBW06]RQO65934.1 hypothetical protein DBR43_27180 [Pedobacter sp. KBW06]
MKNSHIILLFILAVNCSSCGKFLDIEPKGIIIPKKVSDYEGILNSPTMNNTFPIDILVLTDDNFNNFDNTDQSARANEYYWRPVITLNEKSNPEIWGSSYRAIYDANVIISGILTATNGTDAQKQSILAEALVIRANSLLDLLTVFAKAYNPSTADSDPGLPLVISTNVTDKIPKRSSVKLTLNTLINDVSNAVNALPLSNVNRYRVSKYAAYGLLSRIYLYMADYPNAKKYAEMALQAPNTLLNYNNYASSNQVPIYDLNPEVLWQRASVSGDPTFMLYSSDLKTYFDSSDIRYQFLTVTNNDGLGRAGFLGNKYNFGITFPEMYLTKAEMLAREGRFQDAIDIVNMLRKNRIRTVDYVDQTAATSEEALVKVLAERRRELAYSSTRWFDMKRLDQEGRMPEVKRINKDSHEVEASLPPHSPNYTFEIPTRVLMFNPGMELNRK